MKLISPPENWKEAVELDGLSSLEAIKLLAERLDLVVTVDTEAGKIYVGRPAQNEPAKTQKNGDGVHYPSGAYLERSPLNNDPRYAPGTPGSAAPLVVGSWSTKVSKHFTLGEFRPGDDTYKAIRLHPDLVAALERIREKVGKSVKVTSGYRPPAYNRAIGGVSNSQHLDGLAADIYVDGLSTFELHQIALQEIGASGGVGYYPNHGFVHVDVRGWPARWQG